MPRPKHPTLTPKQAEFLGYLLAYRRQHGCLPTLRDAVTDLEMAQGHVQYYFRMLARAGVISREDGSPRYRIHLIPPNELQAEVDHHLAQAAALLKSPYNPNGW